MLNMQIRSVTILYRINHTHKTCKIIQKIGLCLYVYDVLSASDGLIGHGTGIVNVNGQALPTRPLEHF